MRSQPPGPRHAPPEGRARKLQLTPSLPASGSDDPLLPLGRQGSTGPGHLLHHAYRHCRRWCTRWSRLALRLPGRANWAPRSPLASKMATPHGRKRRRRWHRSTKLAAQCRGEPAMAGVGWEKCSYWVRTANQLARTRPASCVSAGRRIEVAVWWDVFREDAHHGPRRKSHGRQGLAPASSGRWHDG